MVTPPERATSPQRRRSRPPPRSRSCIRRSGGGSRLSASAWFGSRTPDPDGRFANAPTSASTWTWFARPSLDLHDDGNDHRLALGGLEEVPTDGRADVLPQDRWVADPLGGAF